MLGSRATMCGARRTRFRVMWAVNSPLRPRKPMLSVAPAITLSTNGSARIARSAPGDTVPDHLLRVDDFVEARLVDVAGFERGILPGQAPIVGLVRDHGSLVVADL